MPCDPSARLRRTDLLDGWRFIFGDPVRRRLFLNSVLVGGLIMATSPIVAVMLLGEYHFTALQYGLAFGVPVVGGFVGARLSARLVERYGWYQDRDRLFGWLRAMFPLVLAFVPPGITGLVIVITSADQVHGRLRPGLRRGTPATNAGDPRRPGF